jgi:hypothetical protein
VSRHESDVISFPSACFTASSGRECAPLTARKSAPDRRIGPVRKLPAVCRLWSPDDRCPALRTGPEAPGKVRQADTCEHTGCPDPSRAVTAYDNNNNSNSNSNNIITIRTRVWRHWVRANSYKVRPAAVAADRSAVDACAGGGGAAADWVLSGADVAMTDLSQVLLGEFRHIKLHNIWPVLYTSAASKWHFTKYSVEAFKSSTFQYLYSTCFKQQVYLLLINYY